MRKITAMLKRRAKLFVLLAFIFFMVVVGLWVFIGGGEETDAEQVAISFYKAAWVEGNAKKAASFGPAGADASDLKGYEAKAENTSVLIAVYSPGKNRLYYIYRPADNTMYAVQLTQHKGKWLVTQYDRKENYSMQMIDQAFPQLRGEWREIQP